MMRKQNNIRNIWGEINARLAAWAKEVTEVVYGIPVQQKNTERKEGQ